MYWLPLEDYHLLLCTLRHSKNLSPEQRSERGTLDLKSVLAFKLTASPPTSPILGEEERGSNKNNYKWKNQLQKLLAILSFI